MSVFSILTNEQLLLSRFVGLLSWDEPEGGETPARLRADLLVLFCALNNHEKFQEVVFGGLIRGTENSRELTDELSVDYRRLEDLRAEIIKLLKSARTESIARLRPLVHSLAARLRVHFAWAQEHLWPRLGPSLGSEADLSLECRAADHMKKLAAEVASCGVHLSDSSGRGSGLPHGNF